MHILHSSQEGCSKKGPTVQQGLAQALTPVGLGFSREVYWPYSTSGYLLTSQLGPRASSRFSSSFLSRLSAMQYMLILCLGACEILSLMSMSCSTVLLAWSEH